MNKILIYILLFTVCSFGQIYVSPSGSDLNTGSIQSPFRTLTKAITKAGADSLIYLRGGVYNDSLTIKLNKSGLAGKPIKVFAYPGETPIIDFTAQAVSTSSRGLYISSSYWHLKGITVRRAKDNGIYITGSNNIVENCIMYGNEDTGLQISGGASNNLILNCDSYLNYDPLTFGENADGFAPKLDIGPGNIFRNCRAWSNSDDGWDMYESDDTVVIENCQAFRNGYNLWGITNYEGDGNGFKLGGNYTAGPHIVKNSIAFDNKGKGFDQNNNIAGLVLYNNTGWKNELGNFALGYVPTQGQHIVKNNLSLAGNVTLAANSIQEKNSWNGFNATENDFVSLDTSTVLCGRDAQGNLLRIDFMRLKQGSALIDAGVNVGIAFMGSAPDLGAYEYDGIQSSMNEEELGMSFILKQNFPNPFNPSTKFNFEVSNSGNLKLEVFNVLGSRIAVVYNDYVNSGLHSINWNAENIPSGVYIAQFNFNSSLYSQKIVLQK